VLNVSSTLFVLKIAQWPAAGFLLILALLGLYRFAPNIRQQRLKWLLPGSVFAAVVWMVASILFKLYVRHFSHFGLLYGSLGTLIILMFWFYLSGIVILAGGEINAILEDAAAGTRFPERKGADNAHRRSGWSNSIPIRREEPGAPDHISGAE
jgi:membrane protein